MKTLIGLVIFFLLGFFLGMYNGYSLVESVTVDNVGSLYQSAVDTAQSGYSGSAVQAQVDKTIDAQQAQLDKAVTAKKDEIKEQMRQQIQDYARQKINSRFGIPSK